ncbi:carnitine O-acetyltransferase [Cryptococcus wingfieldii CBS 7118]|uniref:Carnitine O-acetyltransferase, mitochondrial n=1 Tax=Cryptococcus wingfieldii CBS 7118 TaxID=1295528 RepID=A0A1E3IMC3_9TREE|nr:carnitine O-acetyltransferase [Cryptococcus wingfieldii CBS 7118]ODN89753.1 carnitine O-acetyltransferase [Cryptococcus wingfieldii CBS 7118]
MTLTRSFASSVPRKSAAPQKPLYASQASIPHLPVPTLSSTLHKYIESLPPLLSPEELAKSEKAVNKFLHSDQAKKLQQGLERRAAEKESWLSEWWNEGAYMGYRGRIIPNVNYFYTHKRGLGQGKGQTERAAELIRATVEFKKLVDSEALEPEKTKAGPLCSASYVNLFNSARQPTKPSDLPKSFGPDNHHIVVLRNNRYFKVDTKGRGKKELQEAFEKVIKIADQKEGSGLGILTADDRDLWTETRDHVISMSTANKKSIETIDSSILLLSLDSAPPASAVGDDARAWSLWAGGNDEFGGNQGKGFNRWFDKHEIIVDSAGESGFNGEHSMLDGTPTLRLNEFMLASLANQKIPLELPEGERNSASMPEPEEVVFELDAKTKQIVEESKKGFSEEMARQNLSMVTFNGYGKNFIKTLKTSPDAYSQLTTHLAFYRLFNRSPTTYESCQTRKFLYGRTEVIRATSSEAQAWVKSMLDGKKSDGERRLLWDKAVGRHVQYAKWAADGQGVDRHLYGLKKLVKEGEEMPEIFTDPAYAKSSNWELSTSNLGSAFLDGWGYGEVVPEGYGVSYSVGDNDMKWGVTTMRKDVDAKKFGQALQDAAKEVGEMMERSKKLAESK